MGLGMSDGVIVGIVTGSVTLLVTLLGGTFKTRELRLSGNTNEQTRFFDRLEKDLESARVDVKERDARIEKLESEVYELRLKIERLLLRTRLEIKPAGGETL
jgi:chromosome segregation ATPase